jgi:hypothetical protein
MRQKQTYLASTMVYKSSIYDMLVRPWEREKPRDVSL